MEIDLQWCSPDAWEDPLFDEEMACAIITPVKQDASPHIELYDSGATRHTSPYKPDFISYVPLSPPVFLNTTHQQHFLAIGTGTLTIQVPNLGTESELVLQRLRLIVG